MANPFATDGSGAFQIGIARAFVEQTALELCPHEPDCDQWGWMSDDGLTTYGPTACAGWPEYEWHGQHPFEAGDTLELCLDLEAGTLTAF